MPQTIRYEVYNVETVIETVEGLRVKAKVFSDDRVVDLNIDCTEYLESLSLKELAWLINEEAEYGEEADKIAEYYSDTQADKLFTYLSFKTIGYVVKVDKPSFVTWIKECKTDWLPQLMDDEDVAYYLDD